jgi:putative acetyltransferase
VIEIRREEPGDVPAIREVNRRAFGQDQEANIVDALRGNRAVLLSLVATVDGMIAGHAMYSPASVGPVEGAALGPIAVVPEHQRRGIGARLIEAAHQMLADTACPFVIVLGHPAYYPRFGFVPASSRGIRCAWEVPDDAFMVLVLDDARMQGVEGLAEYRDEFSTVT